MKKKALILGITGQDGSYLAEFLIKKRYQVHGIKRRTSTPNTSRIDHIFDSVNFKNKNLIMHHGDLSDVGSLNRIINQINPDEIYNLAAQSHVKISFQIPEYTSDVNALGPLRLLEIIRHYKRKKIKFYQASSSEMYGSTNNKFQNEYSLLNPQSPYACSKVFSYHITKIYREAFGLFACNGILFNHESERRGETFITKKIVSAAYKISKGELKFLEVGNLNSKRDWGYAPDYIDGIWKMMQQKNADDFVLATGKTYTVRDFIERTFKHLNIKIKWIGKGINEKGINLKNKSVIIKINKKYFRPLEVNYLRGDAKKAKKILKWQPKTNLNKMIKIMLDYEKSD